MPKGTLYVWAIPLLALSLFFWQLHPFWDPDSHYFYGWAVPFMVAYLIWNRLRNAPDPSSPKPLFLLIAVAFITTASFTRLLWEGMSSWYALSWLQGFSLLGFCLAWLALWRGLRWSLHFLFPLCFVLTSIPWLGSIEGPVTLWLTERIAVLVANSLQLLGIPAVLEGALISVGTTTVEVAEACSGIRSLQLLLVTALFLGDYGHFTLGKRIFLIVCGLIAAFTQNAIRALALGWITGIEGQEAYDKWHDPAGMITFTIGLGLLFMVFLILESSAPPEPLDNKDKQERSPPFCLAFSTIAVAGFLFVETFAYVWMRLPVADEVVRFELDREALDEMAFHSKLPVSENVYEILESIDISFGRYIYQGKNLSYYYIEWPDGYPIFAANLHNPSVCMGGYGGLRQIGDREIARLGDEFDRIGYETYLFERPASGQKVLVFRTLMLPEDYQYSSYELIARNEMRMEQHGKWTSKFQLAVDKLLNRIGQNRLTTRGLVLISLNVDSDETANQLMLDPAPLKNFIRSALIRQDSYGSNDPAILSLEQ